MSARTATDTGGVCGGTYRHFGMENISAFILAHSLRPLAGLFDSSDLISLNLQGMAIFSCALKYHYKEAGAIHRTCQTHS